LLNVALVGARARSMPASVHRPPLVRGACANPHNIDGSKAYRPTASWIPGRETLGWRTAKLYAHLWRGSRRHLFAVL